MVALVISMLRGMFGSRVDSRTEVAQTTRGGEESVTWVKVASAAGTPNATVIAGRLESCDIPTRVTQESAGVFGYAVNVGILGTAHVWVPEDLKEQADRVLEMDWDEEE
jgi:hypothetical protein